MITTMLNVRDLLTHRCTREEWQQMIHSEQYRQYIAMYRKELKAGKTDPKDNPWKQRLPVVNYHGYDPKTLHGENGSRKKNAQLPTGFFILDIDHLSRMKAHFNPPSRGKSNGEQSGLKPSQAYNLYLSTLKKLGLKLTEVCVVVHVTPSGDGLRIVMIGREGSTIEADQKWLAEAMGVEYDACTKDLSRWSFIPTANEIFYVNEELMFGEPLTEIYSPTPALPGGGGGKLPPAEGTFKKPSPHPGGDGGGLDDTDPASGKFPETYHGIPYKEIVERYINYHGGTPQVGERHKTLVDLAIDLRNITDNTVDWLMELIPNLGKTRSEKRDVIIWAVKQRPSKLSDRLNDVLKELKEKYKSDVDVDDDVDKKEDPIASEQQKAERAEMPPLPEKLPSLVALCTEKVMAHQKPAVAVMMFPALAAHINNAIFLAGDSNEYELSLMSCLVGKQSVGKGCIDKPIRYIMEDIAAEDIAAREKEQAWAVSQQKKGANKEGKERPHVAIRILESDTTPAAMLQRLYAAEHYGKTTNLCTFTKVDEVEELYSMCPTAGRAKITQLIRKTWDRGSIGAERFTASAANFRTVLRWNFTAAGTIEKVKAFFASSLADGTVSRVDFATIIPPKDRIKFKYGKYDREWRDRLAQYIARLNGFKCATDENGETIPFAIPELAQLEEEMDDYIYDFSEKLEDDTWRDYAWRTKLIAMKKIMVLYIANGCQWEDTFSDFFRWSFNYSMWVKMNLFYQKATEDFKAETIIADRQVHSPLDYLPSQFSRRQFYEVMKRHGFKSEPRVLLCKLRQRDQIAEVAPDTYAVIKK